MLDDKKIKVRYLFSAIEDDLRLYRMDIKALNKDNDDKSKVTIKSLNVASSQVTPKVTLHGILKNAKNQS
mgnify:CR=1 FL=1